jgi:hypothetical protein
VISAFKELTQRSQRAAEIAESATRRFTMSEEELQLLITLDDPGDLPEEDPFDHLHVNNLEYWLSQRFPAWRRLDQRGEAVSDNDGYKVTFGQGDWTCNLARFTGTANDSPVSLDKKFDIEVCTVTQWKNGEIVEQKLFYDLV